MWLVNSRQANATLSDWFDAGGFGTGELCAIRSAFTVGRTYAGYEMKADSLAMSEQMHIYREKELQWAAVRRMCTNLGYSELAADFEATRACRRIAQVMRDLGWTPVLSAERSRQSQMLGLMPQ